MRVIVVAAVVDVAAVAGAAVVDVAVVDVAVAVAVDIAVTLNDRSMMEAGIREDIPHSKRGGPGPPSDGS